jgi:hypothetical protein
MRPLLSLDQLEQLKEKWRQQGAPIPDHLRPGLSDDEMDSLTAPIELTLPTEARTWWGWHDGVDIHEGYPAAQLGPRHDFYTLEHAVGQYRFVREMWHDIDPDKIDYWWRPTWFPITFGNGYIRFDCDVPSRAPAPIYWTHSHDHDHHGLTHPRVPSFGVMVDWWLDAFECEAWRYDADAGRWRYDYALLPPERELTGLV